MPPYLAINTGIHSRLGAAGASFPVRELILEPGVYLILELGVFLTLD